MAASRVAQRLFRGVYPRMGLTQRACSHYGSPARSLACARHMSASSRDDKSLRLARKAARKAHGWASKLPRTRLGPPIRGVHDTDGAPVGQWKEFPAAGVRALTCDMVGGNLTVVVDPALTRGRCWVLNMGEARFRPRVSLDDGVLSVRHVHGLRSYVGQTEPVHTAVFLPRPLQGEMSLSAKMGEVWVFGAGLPTTEEQPASSDGDAAAPPSPCGEQLRVDLALGDIQLFDVTTSAEVMASVGDVTAVWERRVPQLPDAGVNIGLNVGMGDARVLARGDAPLSGFEWKGERVAAREVPFTAHEVAAGTASEGGGSGAAAAATGTGGLISAVGKPKVMGDARLVRWGAHRLPAPADSNVPA